MRIWSVLIWATLLTWLCTLPRQADAQRDVLRDLAQRVEPNGAAVPQRLAHYIRCFRDATFQDRRIHAFQVDAQLEDNGAIKLTGHIEFPEMRDALLAYLRHLGFQRIDDHAEQLPSPQLGDRCFGFVKSPHGLVLTQPRDLAETATDALLGEPLFLLREAGTGFLLCHTAEGYLGYIHGEDVLRVDAAQFHDYQAGKQVRVLKALAGSDTLTIPVGARLKWATQTNTSLTLQLPDGQRTDIPLESGTVINDVPPPRLEQVLATARQFLGTKYLWGGKTMAGVDCSGLVQTSFGASGIHLPRDANQQAVVGRLVATRWHRQGLRRGDTLYFLGRPGKVTHTGIYLGDGQYIEAVTPAVRISSLNPGDANYSRRGDASFAFAKRILD